MATLRGMVRKYGQRGTARILTQSGSPVTVNTVKRAVKAPKSAAFATWDKRARDLPPTGKLIDPGERHVSSQKISAAPERYFNTRIQAHVWRIGKPDRYNRAGDLVSKPLDKRSVSNLIAAAHGEWGASPATMWAIAIFGTMVAPVEYQAGSESGSVRRWVTVVVSEHDVSVAVAGTDGEIAQALDDIRRLNGNPRTIAQQTILLEGEYATRLANRLTEYEWLDVSRMEMRPAKVYARAAEA